MLTKEETTQHITNKINKALTLVIGECWHEGYMFDVNHIEVCNNCDKSYVRNNNFFTWEGFGKLWEWGQTQDWWEEFKSNCNGDRMECFMEEVEPYDWEEIFIEPECFATTLYEFLLATDVLKHQP